MTLDQVLRMIEQAEGPRREIDGAIAELIGAPHGLFGAADEENEIARNFTASLDAALELVPPGWFWQVGRPSAFDGWAAVCAPHPDHGEPEENEFHGKGYGFARTPALCLCHAALRARLSKAGKRSLAEAEARS